MKKLSYLLFVCSFAFSSVFVSCSEDENSSIEIRFANNQNSVTLDEGVTTYEINATITSTAGLSEVKWFKVSGDGKDQIGIVDNFNNNNKNEYNFKESFIVYDDTVIEVQATDKDNVTTSRNFTIKVTKAVVNPSAAVSVWANRVLGAQDNTANGSSCASANGNVYLVAEARTKIGEVDFIYHYQTGGNLAQIVSPAKANLTWLNEIPAASKNDTKFTALLSITDANFNNITATSGSELIGELVTETTATADRAANMTAGKYFGFITAGGKKGIFKVVSLSGTTTGTVTIDIKVMK